jgi:hypothetical protein
MERIYYIGGPHIRCICGNLDNRRIQVLSLLEFADLFLDRIKDSTIAHQALNSGKI